MFRLQWEWPNVTVLCDIFDIHTSAVVGYLVTLYLVLFVTSCVIGIYIFDWFLKLLWCVDLIIWQWIGWWTDVDVPHVFECGLWLWIWLYGSDRSRYVVHHLLVVDYGWWIGCMCHMIFEAFMLFTNLLVATWPDRWLDEFHLHVHVHVKLRVSLRGRFLFEI